MSRNSRIQRDGLTLIELLVVITIMVILTALIVPRVRVVNKDRNIRETARIVGSAFASARDRATTDGAAGILIRRNPNFTYDAAGAIAPPIEYAAMRLYQMRRLPPYTGEYSNSTAMLDYDSMANQYFCEVDEPFDPNLVNAGDTIFFNDSPVGFVILSRAISPNTGSLGQPLIRLVLDIDNVTGIINYQGNLAPPPPLGVPLRYRIERAPQLIETSEVILPEGYYIDLRYSGPLDGSDEDANASTLTKFSLVGDTSDIMVFFARDGGIDRIVYNGNRVRLGGALYLYVTEFDPADADPGNPLDETAMAIRMLSKPNSMWVTIGEQTGGVSIGYNAPPPATATDNFQRISNARALSRNRTNAQQ